MAASNNSALKGLSERSGVFRGWRW